jgi:glycosyltransferase involved in cell wall biosynthesis
LFFPTLLETYGFPYIEAMFFKKPILTSDLDFAHSICEDIAFYFNPHSVESIIGAMLDYDKNYDELNQKISRGYKKAKELPTWADLCNIFNESINKTIDFS